MESLKAPAAVSDCDQSGLWSNGTLSVCVDLCH